MPAEHTATTVYCSTEQIKDLAEQIMRFSLLTKFTTGVNTYACIVILALVDSIGDM
jgi:hypothetical protein